MFIKLGEGDEAAIVGPDHKTGMSALVLGDVVFVTDSAAAARRLLDGAARWHDAVSRDPFIEAGAPVDDERTAALRELLAALSDDELITNEIYAGMQVSDSLQRIRKAISNAELALGY